MKTFKIITIPLALSLLLFLMVSNILLHGSVDVRQVPRPTDTVKSREQLVLTEKQILSTLDSCILKYGQFVALGHPYSYLIDTRLNVFTDNKNQWAIAIERLGYNPRASSILLEIYYYGNCLIHLDQHNGRPTNDYYVTLIDEDNFYSSLDGGGLKESTKYWLVRGKKIPLSHDKKEYLDSHIILKENISNPIGIEDAARFTMLKHSAIFRATDKELYKSIPKNLQKILVLNEWYHRDFYMEGIPDWPDSELKRIYDFNNGLPGKPTMSYESFVASHKYTKAISDKANEKAWKEDRPSAYETWQLLAKVIVTHDTSYYKPTLSPNTH